MIYPHLNPGGMVLPQELTSALSATGTVKLIPSTLAFMTVQRQTATSKSARPSSTEQHLLYGGVPTTTLTNPSRSAQAPSFRVSLGQKGFAGGALGVGFGLGLGSQGPQALLNVARKRREKIRTVAESFWAAMPIA